MSVPSMFGSDRFHCTRNQ